jgi:Gram-negative bacterial TonB protein C-terminal
MLRRFVLVFALAPLLLMATEKKLVRNCCTSDAERVSPKQVNALLDKTEPIQTPCCAHGLHLEGTIVLTIAVDANGEVACVTVVSGHPLIIGSAIDSVRRWKFRSYVMNGLKKNFCGKVAIRYAAADYGIKYEIVQPIRPAKKRTVGIVPGDGMHSVSQRCPI